MKKVFILLLISTLLVACGGETTKEKPKEDKINETIKLDDVLNFKEYDIEMNKIKIYEKKGKLLADIKFDWTNRGYDYGDKMTFFVASLLDAKQGDEELEEIKDAFNPENKNKSDIFFPNAAGGTTSVKLTYELKDSKTPIDLVFTPSIEEDKPETITIEIN